MSRRPKAQTEEKPVQDPGDEDGGQTEIEIIKVENPIVVVGRVVHFYRDGTRPENSNPRAAIITSVIAGCHDGSTVISVAVFEPNGVPAGSAYGDTVPLIPNANEIPESGHYCVWPNRDM